MAISPIGFFSNPSLTDVHAVKPVIRHPLAEQASFGFLPPAVSRPAQPEPSAKPQAMHYQAYFMPLG